MFVWSDVYTNSRMGRPSCYPKPNDAYMLVAYIINFFAPLIITWTSYIGIVYKLKLSMNKAIFDLTAVHLIAYSFIIITNQYYVYRVEHKNVLNFLHCYFAHPK